MNIESLNKKEKKQIDIFQKALRQSYKRNIKKYGFTEQAKDEIKKDIESIGRRIVKSGFKMGLDWLNSK